jgi:NAD-dependent deacetylase
VSIDAAAALLRRARAAVALTGAGVSTESGLPDFRSPGGLWAGIDPMRVASLSAFRRRPQEFYAFYQQRLAALRGAQPNAAHRALAELERRGVLHAVITQNVDGLHTAAGSQRVLELHGSLRRAACPVCGRRHSMAAFEEALAAGAVPRCEQCGSPLKPDVVLFEELLPPDVFAAAERLCQGADLLLVVGSSLQVTPAAGLPRTVLDHGGCLLIINQEPTPFDSAAAVVLRGAAGALLPALVRRLAGRAPAAAEDEQRPPARS